MAHAGDNVVHSSGEHISNSPRHISSNTAENDERYSHEVLPDPSKHIRLLELDDPDSWNENRTYCKLTVIPLEEAPPYHAISYVWGDPTPRGTVHLDGKTLCVPDSSVAVLRQLAYHRTSRYYWIDAICIAQGDIPEKNARVAIMGQIYERAEHVLACIDYDEGMEAESLMMADVDSTVPSASDVVAALDGPFLDDGRSNPLWKENIDQDLLVVLEGCVVALGERTSGFMSRLLEVSRLPYFERM